MDNLIKVVLFEDDGHFATHLQRYIEFQNDIKVLRRFEKFEMNCLEELIKLEPDLIILDIQVPPNCPYDGIQAAKMIDNTLELNNCKILMLTSHIDEEKICAALINGADGYVEKTDRENIINSIRDVHRGDSVLSKSVQKKLLEIVKSLIGGAKIEGFEKELTEKELVIWLARIRGDSYKTIAENMGMTVDGVKFYIRKINKKLRDFKAKRYNILGKIKNLF